MSLVIRIFSFLSWCPASLGLGESNPRGGVGGTGFQSRSRVRHVCVREHVRERKLARSSKSKDRGAIGGKEKDHRSLVASVGRRCSLPFSSRVRSSSAFAFHGSLTSSIETARGFVRSCCFNIFFPGLRSADEFSVATFRRPFRLSR